ncbi:hypothetical protein JHK82_012617 [Glycine max]|nr:hypothetical protein JHK82_012617 [Glycine max]
MLLHACHSPWVTYTRGFVGCSCTHAKGGTYWRLCDKLVHICHSSWVTYTGVMVVIRSCMYATRRGWHTLDSCCWKNELTKDSPWVLGAMEHYDVSDFDSANLEALSIGDCIELTNVAFQLIGILVGKFTSLEYLDVTSCPNITKNGLHEINIDTALFNKANKLGVVVCIRGDDENFISTKSMTFDGSPEPREAETLGLLRGIQWAHQLGLENIQFEIDSRNVVDGLKSSSRGNTGFHVLLPRSRLLLLNFQNSMVSFIRRTVNIVAYTLARQRWMHLICGDTIVGIRPTTVGPTTEESMTADEIINVVIEEICPTPFMDDNEIEKLSHPDFNTQVSLAWQPMKSWVRNIENLTKVLKA